MVFINALLTFGIAAKFPRQKFGSISPYFRGGNPVAFHHGCIIIHKTLFSPTFHCENMATKVPHFHSENPAEFRI